MARNGAPEARDARGFLQSESRADLPMQRPGSGLEAELMCLTKFDYPNYEIFFAVASNNDPAMKVIERIKTSPAKEKYTS